jgi:ferric-dicitrate binding protein FerR (iron transport regulator)
MRAMLSLAILLTLLASAPAARAQQAPAGEAVGRVVALTGPASAWAAGTPRALSLGAHVHRGETLRTLAGAKLVVRFTDGAELILGADSQAAVAAYAPAQGTAAMQLMRGILRLVLDPARVWRRFEVETRSAVAAARSTEWIVALDAEAATAVFVIAGRVDVRAQGRTVTLAPGEGTDVPAGAPPGPVTQWGQARVDEVRAATTLP